MKSIFRFVLLINLSLCLIRCSEDEPKILPNISVNDSTVNEGGQLWFNIKIDKPTTDTIKFLYRTEDITASSSDYFPVMTALEGTINPGVNGLTIVITTKTDAAAEADETFRLVLSDVENAKILDGEAIGTIKNMAAPTINYFMKAKIGTQLWIAKIGGFFGAAFIGNTFAGYGTDNDSQLSFVFKSDPPTVRTYGLEEIMATANDKVAVFYSPKFFTGGMTGQTFNGQPGGQVVISKYDVTNKVVEGTFSFTGKDSNGNTIQVTEGSFKVPIE